MKKLIGHHACKNTGNWREIEKKGIPGAKSNYNSSNDKNPFLGSGFYFWDYNLEMAKYWGKSHYGDSYYIFEAEIPYNEDDILDLVGNRQHMEWLVNLMHDFKQENEGSFHWEIGRFLEFLKEISKEVGDSSFFPFKAIRAIDHSASKAQFHFYQQSKQYINLNPRIIICVKEISSANLKNLKLIYQK